jgi:hypothetical protein
MGDLFAGITMGPTSFYDEGIDYVLDLLQDKVGINAIACYTYQRMTPGCRPPGAIADHGKPIDRERNDDTLTWVQVNEKYYGGTFLRHQPKNKGERYWDKDILADLEKPAQERGIRIYSRILEGWRQYGRPNFVKVNEIDALGRLAGRQCYNNPDYINFWLGTVEDLFKTYPYLAGIYWGSENSGPLPRALSGGTPTCFCKHCCRIARENGIDPERARRGLLALRDLARGLRAGERPTDGAFISIFRLLIGNPEILAWEKQWVESYNRLPRLMSGALKTLGPAYELGYHADHAVTGLSPFKRADFPYEELSEIYDWVKPCVYHMCAGPRLNGNIGSLHQTLLADLSRQQALDWYYAINGYDASEEPNAEQLAAHDLTTAMLSANYTYREIKRAVEGAGGRCAIYSGVAFGIPVWNEPAPEDREITYTDCVKALEAGADGFLISREYDENEIPNLEAVGRAIREAR